MGVVADDQPGAVVGKAARQRPRRRPRKMPELPVPMGDDADEVGLRRPAARRNRRARDRRASSPGRQIPARLALRHSRECREGDAEAVEIDGPRQARLRSPRWSRCPARRATAASRQNLRCPGRACGCWRATARAARARCPPPSSVSDRNAAVIAWRAPAAVPSGLRTRSTTGLSQLPITRSADAISALEPLVDHRRRAVGDRRDVADEDEPPGRGGRRRHQRRRSRQEAMPVAAKRRLQQPRQPRQFVAKREIAHAPFYFPASGRAMGLRATHRHGFLVR